jgi:hypothetical protein
VLPTHIDETNISFHLVSIIKYIKEEEVEERETESGLTGPCMEEMLHRKMPDALVGWAIEDVLTDLHINYKGLHRDQFVSINMSIVNVNLCRNWLECMFRC